MTTSKQQNEQGARKQKQDTRTAPTVKTGLRAGVVEAEAPESYDGYQPQYP